MKYCLTYFVPIEQHIYRAKAREILHDVLKRINNRQDLK